MNLLFCINHSYIEQFLFCVRSIIRFPDEYNIFVFHTDLSKDDQEYILESLPASISFSFIYIDNDALKDFPTTKRYPLEIYYRIMSAMYLPKDIDKILYLDSNIVVINPLTDLYNTNIDSYYYAGCSHVRKLITWFNHKRLNTKQINPYLNTSVLLMNLKNLREHQSKQEVLSFVNKHNKRLWLPDQDIISSLYGDKILFLDYFKYNLSDRMLFIYNFEHPFKKRNISWVQKNCSIIHYCGKNKPWNSKYYGKLDVFYKSLLNYEN